MALNHSKSDAVFIDKVKSDLTLFVESSSVDSVLVFPPVNSFHRFLLHQLAQDSFDQLRTFSIGEDPDRRIVVCNKDLVARVDASKDESLASVKAVAASSELTMVVTDTDRSISSQVKKSRSSLPTIGIYRPPAARKSTDSSSKVHITPVSESAIVDTAKNAITSASGRTRARRPDQQVYVPRAKRSCKDSEKYEDVSAVSLDTGSSSQLANTSSSSLIIDDKKSSKQRSFSPTDSPQSLPPRASQLVETKKKLCQSTSSDLDCIGSRRISTESERLSSTMNPAQSVHIPPRVEVLVEKKKNLCQTQSLTLEDFRWKTKDGDIQEINLGVLSDCSAESEQPSAIPCSKIKNSTVVSESEIASVIDLKVTNTVSGMTGDCDIVQVECSTEHEEIMNTVKSKKTSRDSDSSKIIVTDDNSLRPPNQFIQGTESSDDDYPDAQNEEKTSAATNMSDRSSGGSSESLSSSDSVNSHVSPVQLMKPVKSEPKKKASTEKTSRVFNPDECDWDALLDEDGDVLDPFLMKELASVVGEVQVTQPKSDYRNYRSQVPADHHKTRRSTTDEDFSHVVEISSFPPEFKTSDLVAVLSPFKNIAGGFEIKWVDDTHALGVFASTLIAEQVLAYQHPMVRTRPLCDATLESRLKARRLSESIQSFRPRPETCAALARRLVTGALGVKLPTARQEREEEKRVLREAREKRRLAVQQQDEVWNS